jgi:protein-disulfide isomerase
VVSKKLIGGVVAAAAAVVAILVGVQVLGGDDTPTKASQFQDVPAVIALVKGIPQNGPVIGDPKAPVTITEFADLQCSVCAAASTGVVRELITKYARTGKAKLEPRFRAWSLRR